MPDLWRNTKPLISIACACERTLLETDGVLSAIRLVDTYRFKLAAGVDAGSEAHTDQPSIQTTVLLSLKSGDFTGEGVLSLVFWGPNGRPNDFPQNWPLVFKGGEHGNNIILNLTIPVTNEGVYWLEVLWSGEALTKIPIKLAAATDRQKQ